MRVDPTGALDTDEIDGYTVDKDGNVEWADKTGGSAFDVLYNLENYESGKKDYNETGDGDNGLIVNDTDILKELKVVRSIAVKKDYDGYVYKSGNKRTVETGKESGDDMVNVFLFLANNSDVEWNINYAIVNGTIKYGLGTYGWNDRSPNVLDKDGRITGIHSHPKPNSYQDELHSMYGDRSKSKDRNYIQYVYMKGSGRLFHVKDGKSYYNSHINGNSSNFINMGIR
jgi:hypothetical protein